MELVQAVPAEAKVGDVVDARIVRFPQDANERPGVVVEGILGVQGITAVEVAKIKIRENVVEEFPPAVLAEAANIPQRVAPADKVGREDLRELDLCTIDPADARDHDDALFIERIKGGGFHVVVAIADVSHYVRLGTAIDDEAQARCTSIYLPDRVIPMLPHEISSNLASLVPKKDRLCLAVDITLDATGRVTHHRYIEGIMRSTAKLTYEGVADALGLTTEGGVKQPAARERVPMLQALLDLSRILRQRRLERGALDFDLPEPRVKLDEQGEPIDVVRSRQDPGVREAYRVVEEMMLLANETVASDLSQRGIPAIYRTHGAPAAEKLETFCELATSLGEPLDAEAAQDPKQLTEFLARIEGEPAAPVLRYLLLRAMQQAIYGTDDVGHFGLAAKHYLHFTSPIRRYPDLAVHRVVRALARGEFVDGALLLPMLRKMAARSSQLERRAMTVERDVVSLYRCLVMRDKVGEEMNATISGLDETGFYASIDSPFVDVFVPCERLTDDYYAVDRLGVRLVGQRGGRVFEMGQPITIRVVSVGLERRRVEAELVGVLEERRQPGGRGALTRRRRRQAARRVAGQARQAEAGRARGCAEQVGQQARQVGRQGGRQGGRQAQWRQVGWQARCGQQAGRGQAQPEALRRAHAGDSAAQFGPVLHLDTLEAGEVLHVDGHERQLVHVGYGGDLPVDEGRRLSQPLEPGSLDTMPVGSILVVGQHGKRREHHILEIGLDRVATLAAREPLAPKRQLVPNRRSDGALVTVLFQLAEHAGVRLLRDGRRDDVGVQQEAGGQSATFRPGSRSRADANTSSSKPNSCGGCMAVNRRKASPKGTRPPRSRSNSCTDITTATGLPRRVSSISSPAAAWSTMLGKLERASAMEYCFATK
jgi:ribonuclease R